MVGRAAHLEKGGRRFFVVLYVVGYPDFNNLMALCIDEISIILTPGMPHLYFSIVVGRYLDRFARFYSLQTPLFPLQKRKKKKPSDSLSFFFISHTLSNKSPPWTTAIQSLSSITCIVIVSTILLEVNPASIRIYTESLELPPDSHLITPCGGHRVFVQVQGPFYEERKKSAEASDEKNITSQQMNRCLISKLTSPEDMKDSGDESIEQTYFQGSFSLSLHITPPVTNGLLSGPTNKMAESKSNRTAHFSICS